MSKLKRHSNGSFSVTTDSGAKNIHVEVFAYIGELETKVKELKDLLSSFDWEIRGSHVLTGTCTRLTDSQINLLND